MSPSFMLFESNKNRTLSRLSALLLIIPLLSIPLKCQSDSDLSVFQLMENLEQKNFSGRPVDFSFKEKEIRAVIAEIAELSGLTFRVDPQLSRKVTLIFKQTPWDQILSLTLEENGLRARLANGVILIEKSDRALFHIVEKENPGTAGRSLIFWLLILGLPMILLTSGVVFFLRKKHKAASTGRKYSVDSERAELIEKKVNYYFEVEKIYRDENITLLTLAAVLDIPAHQLSWVLNERMKNTFSELVNRCRIEEVKKRLSDPGSKKLTVLEIAFDAGFNTKSSFNRMFKRATGKTPTQFRDKYLHERS